MRDPTYIKYSADGNGNYKLSDAIDIDFEIQTYSCSTL